MNYLLDTHILLWWLDNNQTISPEAKIIISNSQNTIFISAVTAWEISIKKAIGKLEIPNNFEDAIQANNFSELPITIQDGLTAGKLPFYHKDPFDRMLIAQAINYNLTIITRDSQFNNYQVKLLLA